MLVVLALILLIATFYCSCVWMFLHLCFAAWNFYSSDLSNLSIECTGTVNVTLFINLFYIIICSIMKLWKSKSNIQLRIY